MSTTAVMAARLGKILARLNIAMNHNNRPIISKTKDA